MQINTVVSPSTQVDSVLPQYIAETYGQFVKFMTFADQSEERIGFSQDLLQNLQYYRDFNTYKDKIIQEGVLRNNLLSDEDELTLEDATGFPNENGVVQINDEIILYRRREGNKLVELQRGASGTVILPTFTHVGEYINSIPANHDHGAPVKNISVLFLVGFLKTIYQSYVPNINPERISPEINNATFLENVIDFFQSKGSKLGIQALFKLLFADNDVDVNYPGDRMIMPSKSTWSEAQILRVVPQPRNLIDPNINYVIPTKVMNSFITLRSYNDDLVYARSICDYVSSYPYEDNIQYELYLNKDKNQGDFLANPITRLTRNLFDGDTITVESTLGFPETGILFIENEGISYEYKTFNQFFKCKRGVRGYAVNHRVDSKVYGPFYIESSITIDGVKRTSISYPLGLVKDINVVDGGFLHKTTDDVYINGPGRIDPREPALASFIENYDDQLVTQADRPPFITDVSYFTASVDGVFFDADYVYVSSSGFPYYSIGKFSDNQTVGTKLIPNPSVWVIPRHKQSNADIPSKGTDQIGISVDGVPIYSESSNIKLIQGDIASFGITNRGSGYISPTVIIDPDNSQATATVENGQISRINPVSIGEYIDTPVVRVSSGEGAQFEFELDNYGRIISATVTDGGQYYNDFPEIIVVDSTGRGSGALINAILRNGEIRGLIIVSPGIDYNKPSTRIEAVPQGSGAEIVANVESYNFNRYYEVVNNPNWTFDSGNGFLWGTGADPLELTTYGYVCSPTQLRSSLDDDGTKHSPILGWAFDGNPIYGPFGYKNGVNDSGGIVRQKTGYELRDDRSGEGTMPPTVSDYPMGSFSEDFEYDPLPSSIFILETEAGDDLITQGGLEMQTNTDEIEINVLDANNGRICNTPEYQAQDYPKGVYAYFVTVDENNIPMFPYFIGTTFNNRPLSQNKVFENVEQKATIIKGKDDGTIKLSPSSYDDTEIKFDLEVVERYRNPYLNETKNEINLEIADVSKGGISSIIVENGLPAISKVGDILNYPAPTTGGDGAQGVVTFLTGKQITSAYGSIVETRLRSHRQVIDLSDYLGEESFVFVEGTQVYDTSGAIGTVRNWDTETYTLEVQCETYYLFKYSNPKTPNNPFFLYDNRNTPIQLRTPPSALYNGPTGQTLLGASRPNRVLMAEGLPVVGIGGFEPEPGDISWSIGYGRLFVYYDDGDTIQWVESQPVGMQPFGKAGASNTSAGTTVSTTQDILNYGLDNTVTISTMGPSSRSDGSENRMGDLWWSSQTGILYIWYHDIDGSTAWVMTEPSGTVPTAGAIDQVWPEVSDEAAVRGNIFTRSIVVTISDTAPTVHSDGSLIVIGDLWWSSSNGKMYIYYEDTPGTATNSIQWVQCNPVGSISTQYGSDDPPTGPDGPTPPSPTPPIPPGPGPGPDPFPGGDFYVLPELPEQKLLWFVDTTNFLPEDVVSFERGLPGVASTTEISRIEELGRPIFNNAEFLRGYNDRAILLPEGVQMENNTRAIFTVNTAEPHDLVPGDQVLFEQSNLTGIDGVHTVARAGKIIPGSISVIVDRNGRVKRFDIEDPGQFYTRDFLISCVGGGGQGAFGIGRVSDLSQGGRIISTERISRGANYTSRPEAILGRELTNTAFEIYVDQYYRDETGNIKYSTDGDAVESTVAYVGLTSGGSGYVDIPPADGIVKKASNRAYFEVNNSRIDFDGMSIDTIKILNGGSRYTTPTAIFGDKLGNGSGATADVTVTDGVVTDVTITNQGQGYIEPVMTLVEEEGKYISLTKDIGVIRAGSVINAGRDISVDRSLRPELQITTRCIVTWIDSSRGYFAEGSQVFQGTVDNKLVTATVVSYDDKIQQLTLEKVDGVLRADEAIRDEYGTVAMILLEGEADCRAVVSGTSEPKGKFINETGLLSTEYAVIQDSRKYQWFSYEISTTLQRSDYENFVYDIVHPTGFLLLSALGINSAVDASSTALYVDEDQRFFDIDSYNGELLAGDGLGPIALINVAGRDPITLIDPEEEDDFDDRPGTG